MGFKDSRSGKDLLLQPILQQETTYRAVVNDPPTEDDFVSHAVSGVRPIPQDRPTAQHSGLACRCFETRDAVDRFIARRQAVGETYYPAEMLLLPGIGLDVFYHPKNKHLDVYGFPEVLLACFQGIV